MQVTFTVLNVVQGYIVIEIKLTDTIATAVDTMKAAKATALHITFVKVCSTR